MAVNQNIVVLVGGVGGAKLALGLAKIVPPERLTIIVNTGDDFTHYGLRICPDIDTLLYTLTGRVDPVNGWGVAGDSRIMLETLRTFGEDPWFGLGDKDLALHLLRTSLLQKGHSLTQVIDHLAKSTGIAPRVLPMTDSPVATMVNTDQGELEFQVYFVKHRWQPVVNGLRFAGVDSAQMTPEVSTAIANADVILFGPSNPWLSIAPILAVPGLQDALVSKDVPRVAVTPIIKGEAIKGPAAKLMGELGYSVTMQAVAEYYGDVINGFVYDSLDEPWHYDILRTIAFNTIMKTESDKITLATRVLDWIKRW